MEINVIKTVYGSTPMQNVSDYSFSDDKEKENTLICVYPDVEYQEIKGFGGAFTEAASTTFDKMSSKNREKILKLYFDPEDGIGYNFGRVHINSCDFSLGNYTCVEEGDNNLSTFNIKRDESSVIPMIKAAMEYNDIYMFASPWSPPAYMKTTNRMNGGGKLKAEYYELWAEYFVKFIEAYKNHGIDIDMITVQNEPKAVQTWDSCVYSPEEERDFVKNYLGKKMQDMGVKIVFWDHNKERVVDRAKIMMADEDAAKYIHGIGIHWYSGDHFEQLEMFNKLYPQCDIIFTEGCYEYSKGEEEAVSIGERYAHDIIGNFNNYCNMFCDWNLLLNKDGGPNHVGNFCDAPIMADTKKDEVRVNASYYYIGHFSKFVKSGAKRIGSSKWTSDIDTVSFKNPDGSVVSVVLNASDKDYEFSFSINGEMIDCKCEAHSIATYIFK